MRSGGHRPQKKWGQNFLRNRGAVERIAAALEPRPDELVVEIGPGEGALTSELVKVAPRLRLIEIDPSLARRLTAELGTAVEVINADATEAPFPDEPFRVVGNLPYNVATPIIRRVLLSDSWQRAVFMVQKEVADRITARPGEEPYGYLTLLVSMRAEARQILTLAPGSFFPVPKVRSAVVQLDPVDRGLATPHPELVSLVSRSFRQRRKKLLNNLDGYRGLTREEAAVAIRDSGLEEGVRAETMSLEDFDRLAQVIGHRAGEPAVPEPEELP